MSFFSNVRSKNTRNIFSWGMVLNILCLICLTLFLTDCGQGSPTTVPMPKVHHVSLPQPPSVYILSKGGALSAYQASGALLWQKGDEQIGGGVIPNGTHLWMTKQALYTATDALRAYTLSGQLIWQHTLSAAAVDTLLVDETLYVIETGGIITAWNRETGKLLWQQTQGILPLGGQFVLAQDAHHLFIGGINRLSAFDLHTGAVLWTRDGDPGENIQKILLHGTSLLLCTTGSLTDIDTQTGKQRWQQATQELSLYLNVGTGTLYTVYIDVNLPSGGGASSTSGLRAMDVQTGKVLWEKHYPINMGDNGTISPAGFLWTSQTQMTSWDLEGQQRWQQPYQGAPIEEIRNLEDHSFLLIAQDASLTDLDAQTGKQTWQQIVGSSASLGQVLIQPTLIWAVSASSVHAFATKTGTKLWALESIPEPAAIAIV